MTRNTHDNKCIDVLITNLHSLYQVPLVVAAIQPENPRKAKPSDHLVPVAYSISCESGSVTREYHMKTVRPLPGIRIFGQWPVWKATRRIFPKHKDKTPIALNDHQGNLISEYEAIKKFALESMVERLRKRPVQPGLEKLEKSKIKLCRLRLKRAREGKTTPWSMKQMNIAIRSMKNKKCRYPDGIINELLKKIVAGKDFIMSLLSLLNKTKRHLEIPYFMRNVSIALI